MGNLKKIAICLRIFLIRFRFWKIFLIGAYPGNVAVFVESFQVSWWSFNVLKTVLKTLFYSTEVQLASKEQLPHVKKKKKAQTGFSCCSLDTTKKFKHMRLTKTINWVDSEIFPDKKKTAKPITFNKAILFKELQLTNYENILYSSR